MLVPAARRTALGVVGAAVIVGLTSCMPQPPGLVADPTVPARPAAIDVSGRHPCELLDTAQRSDLDLGAGKVDNATIGGRPAPTCGYLGTDPAGVDVNLQFIPVPTSQLLSVPGTAPVDVSGYRAAETVYPSSSYPSCEVGVDIDDATSLRAQAMATSSNLQRSGTTDRDLCTRARAVAAAALPSLIHR